MVIFGHYLAIPVIVIGKYFLYKSVNFEWKVQSDFVCWSFTISCFWHFIGLQKSRLTLKFKRILEKQNNKMFKGKMKFDYYWVLVIWIWKTFSGKGVSPLLQKIPWNILTSHLICFSRKVVLEKWFFKLGFFSGQPFFSNQKKNPSLKNHFSGTRFLKPDF